MHRHRRVHFKVLLFAWLATSWDAFSRYRMSGLLGGHMLAVSVCLTHVAPEIKESHAADRDHRSVPTQMDQPTNYPKLTV